MRTISAVRTAISSMVRMTFDDRLQLCWIIRRLLQLKGCLDGVMVHFGVDLCRVFVPMGSCLGKLSGDRRSIEVGAVVGVDDGSGGCGSGGSGCSGCAPGSYDTLAGGI